MTKNMSNYLVKISARILDLEAEVKHLDYSIHQDADYLNGQIYALKLVKKELCDIL